MARPPWGHVSRRCVRCGKVGPRVWHGGLVHFYCLTNEEKRERRRRQREGPPA